MKFTAALLITNVAGASAFAPPRRHSSIKQQRSQQQSPTAVHLVGDSSILQADIVEGLVSTVGSLALLGSVGFGVFAGYKDDEWDYEYKPGNEEASKKYGAGADLALIEVSPEEVAEDIVKVCLNFTSSHNRCILILCSNLWRVASDVDHVCILQYIPFTSSPSTFSYIFYKTYPYHTSLSIIYRPKKLQQHPLITQPPKSHSLAKLKKQQHQRKPQSQPNQPKPNPQVIQS